MSNLYGSATFRDGTLHRVHPTRTFNGGPLAACSCWLSISWLRPLGDGDRVCRRPACARSVSALEG